MMNSLDFEYPPTLEKMTISIKLPYPSQSMLVSGTSTKSSFFTPKIYCKIAILFPSPLEPNFFF